MNTPARLHRRSFMLQVAGALAVGGLAAAVTGAATAQPSTTQRPTGRSDTDAGARADRGGYGRTGVTDRDPYDQAGRGVGAGAGRNTQPDQNPSYGAAAPGGAPPSQPDQNFSYGASEPPSAMRECNRLQPYAEIRQEEMIGAINGQVPPEPGNRRLSRERCQQLAREGHGYLRNRPPNGVTDRDQGQWGDLPSRGRGQSSYADRRE